MTSMRSKGNFISRPETDTATSRASEGETRSQKRSVTFHDVATVITFNDESTFPGRVNARPGRNENSQSICHETSSSDSSEFFGGYKRGRDRRQVTRSSRRRARLSGARTSRHECRAPVSYERQEQNLERHDDLNDFLFEAMLMERNSKILNTLTQSSEIYQQELETYNGHPEGS